MSSEKWSGHTARTSSGDGNDPPAPRGPGRPAAGGGADGSRPVLRRAGGSAPRGRRRGPERLRRRLGSPRRPRPRRQEARHARPDVAVSGTARERGVVTIGPPPDRPPRRPGRRRARDQLRGSPDSSRRSRRHGARPGGVAVPRALPASVIGLSSPRSTGCPLRRTRARAFAVRPTGAGRTAQASTRLGSGSSRMGSMGSMASMVARSRRASAVHELRRTSSHLARWSRAKDLPTLVRAFAELARDHGDLELVVAGPDGWGAPAFAAAVAASGVSPADRACRLSQGNRASGAPARRNGSRLPVLVRGLRLPSSRGDGARGAGGGDGRGRRSGGGRRRRRARAAR